MDKLQNRRPLASDGRTAAAAAAADAAFNITIGWLEAGFLRGAENPGPLELKRPKNYSSA